MTVEHFTWNLLLIKDKTCDAKKQNFKFARHNIQCCYNASRFLLSIKQHEIIHWDVSKICMFTFCLQGSITVMKVKREPNDVKFV